MQNLVLLISIICIEKINLWEKNEPVDEFNEAVQLPRL